MGEKEPITGHIEYKLPIYTVLTQELLTQSSETTLTPLLRQRTTTSSCGRSLPRTYRRLPPPPPRRRSTRRWPSAAVVWSGARL